MDSFTEKPVSLTSLLDIVRNIDYNFSVKETPFSVKISIRKTKIHYHEGIIQENQFLEANSEHLDTIKSLEIEKGSYIAKFSNQNQLIASLEAEVEKLSNEKKSLEKSSKNFERQTIVLEKSLEKKINECEIMQKSLNSQNLEISKLHDILKQNGRMLKVKEKEIYDIAKKNDDLVDTCKVRKETISKLRKENKKLEKDLNRQYQVKETSAAVNLLAKAGSSNLTSTISTPLPSLILPLNLPSSVSQSASSLAVVSTTSSTTPSLPFNSPTSLVSSLDSTITSTATSGKRNSTDSSDASQEIPDPSLHPQDSTESSLPAETLNMLYSRSTWAPLQLAVQKLEESMNQMSEKL